MNNNFEQLNTLKKLTLTDTERGRIRAHLARAMNTTPLGSRVPSMFQRSLHHGLRIALSSFAFFLFVGGTISAVASNALPGDPLYAFKINVNEEIKGFFQQTPEEKVAYNAKRVETRVNEIKTLAASKTLTKAKQATVQKAIDEHIKDLSAGLTTLSNTAPTTALAVTSNLEDTLKENKALLETDPSVTPDAVQTVDSTIAQVSNQEVKILSKEIDDISTDVAATTVASNTSIDTTTPSATSTPVEP